VGIFCTLVVLTADYQPFPAKIGSNLKKLFKIVKNYNKKWVN